MLRRAAGGFPRVVADAAQLPFATASYDVVVLAFMLFHVPVPATALAEVRRVLTPGGQVGVTTWGKDADIPALGVWNAELDRHGAPEALPLIAQHDLMDTPAKLRGLLEGAGFSAASVELMPWSHGRAWRSSSSSG